MSSAFSPCAAAAERDNLLLGDPSRGRFFYGFGVASGDSEGSGVGAGAKSTHSCVSHCPMSLSPRERTRPSARTPTICVELAEMATMFRQSDTSGRCANENARENTRPLSLSAYTPFGVHTMASMLEKPETSSPFAKTGQYDFNPALLAVAALSATRSK